MGADQPRAGNRVAGPHPPGTPKWSPAARRAGPWGPELRSEPRLRRESGPLRAMRRHGIDHEGRLALLGIEYTSIMTAGRTKDEHNGWLLIPFCRSWPGVAGAVMAGV